MPLIFWIGCLGTLAPVESPGPLRWSPDGRWLAFAEKVRTDDRPSRLAPLVFGTPSPSTASVVDLQASTLYKLWAYCPDDSQSILLDEHDGPISSPSWSGDGSKMVFGRIVGGAPQNAPGWELVLQDGPRKQRVLFREDFPGLAPSANEFGSLEIAWSGDGRTLAIRSFQKSGLILLKADTGQTIRFLDRASQPRWSREDARLAFFRGATSTELVVLDAPNREPRRLMEVPPDTDHLPGPFWVADGKTLTFLRRSSSTTSGPPRTAQAVSDVLKLWRVRADTGQTEAIIDLVHDPIARGATELSAWYSPDPIGPSVFYATSTPGQIPMQFSWCQSRPNEVHKRLNPLDLAATQGALSTQPGGRFVALRFCRDGTWSPPALCDPVTERVECVAPDRSARQGWLAMITGLMSQSLAEGLPAAAMTDLSAAERPTRLPLPGELAANSALAGRLRRLAGIAMPLIANRHDEGDRELRLATAYLAGDYPQAMSAVEEMLTQEEDSERRGRLLGVKAQIHMARGDFAGAGPIIEHLRRTEAGPRFAIETDLGRPRMLPASRGQASWTDFLADSLLKLQTPAADSDESMQEELDEDLLDSGPQGQPSARPHAGDRIRPRL